MLNPSTVNELRLNYTRFAFLKNKPVGGLGKIEDFGYFRGDAILNRMAATNACISP